MPWCWGNDSPAHPQRSDHQVLLPLCVPHTECHTHTHTTHTHAHVHTHACTHRTHSQAHNTHTCTHTHAHHTCARRHTLTRTPHTHTAHTPLTLTCTHAHAHTRTCTHTLTPHIHAHTHMHTHSHTLPHIRSAMRQALQADLISLQLPHSALLITSLRNGLFICKTRFIMPSLQGWLWTLNEVFTHILLHISLGTRGRDSSHQLDLNCGSTTSQLCDPGQITKFPPAFISSSVKTGREVFTFFLGLLQRLNKAVQAKGLELCLAEGQHYRRVSFSYDSILLLGAFSSLHSPLPPSQLDCPSTKVFRLKPVCPIHHNLPFIWERREGEKEEERGRERRFSWGG